MSTQPEANAVDPRFKPQLTQLNPSEPEIYLTVGEYLGAIAQTSDQHQLAIQSLMIGAGLAERQGNNPLAASMCIAAASLEADPQWSASLWDLALLLDPHRLNAWNEFRDQRAEEFQRMRETAASCLAATRYGDLKRAEELIAKRGIRDQIKEAALTVGVDPNRFMSELSEMLIETDDECRGRIFIAERANGEVRRVVCQDHIRPIGATDNDALLRSFLAIESELLKADSAEIIRFSWAASAYLNTNHSTHNPTIGQMLQRYDVDLTMPYWRVNHWASKQ